MQSLGNQNGQGTSKLGQPALMRENDQQVARHLKPEVYRKFWVEGFPTPFTDGRSPLPLHEALCSGTESSFLESLENTVEIWKHINNPDKAGNTPILLATLLGKSKKVLDCLCQKGAIWIWKNYWDESILHLAVVAGNIKALEYFVQKGADFNARDIEGSTPVHKLHLLPDDLNIFQKALHFLDNADLMAADKKGNTALHYVAAYKSDQEMKELLNHICKFETGTQYLDRVRTCVTFPNLRGYTPIYGAVCSGNIGVLQFLEKIFGKDFKKFEFGFDTKSKQGINLLHAVALGTRINFQQMILFALNAGIKIDSKTVKGNTPLLVAVAVGRSPKELELLIELGANWKLTNGNGEGVLHVAASKGHLKIIKYFVEKKNADVGLLTNSGKNMFHYLATAPKNFVPILQMLQQKGLATSVQFKKGDRKGHDFLMKCVFADRPAWDIEYLLKFNSDCMAVDKSDQCVIREFNSKSQKGTKPLRHASHSEKKPIQKFTNSKESSSLRLD